MREGKYIGIHAVKSGSYNEGYQCLHLGYGVDKNVQAPTILTDACVPVVLFGKVADIVANDGGKSVSCVPTGEVLDLTIDEIKTRKNGFICTNVQETDLAGHSQDADWYRRLLEIADEKIGEMIPLLGEEDILLVMADHGNDPDIGHNKHTRENVPLLVYKKGIHSVELGLRSSLSDVGATVCDFFGKAGLAIKIRLQKSLFGNLQTGETMPCRRNILIRKGAFGKSRGEWASADAPADSRLQIQ